MNKENKKKINKRYFFTADEHYFHKNIILYCKRPFDNVEHMNSVLINNHNKIVTDNDVTVHLGDFSFVGITKTNEIIKQLNGEHIFLKGSHDSWMKGFVPIREIDIEGQKVVCCHYPLSSWPASHYGTFHFHGHTHNAPKITKSNRINVGVDFHDYKPVLFNDLLMEIDNYEQ